MANLPIDLWYTVVHPTLVNPEKDIGIKVIIALQALCLAARRVTAHITVNSERRYTELHPWLKLAHGAMKLVYKVINVLPAPLALACISILGELGFVIELLALYRIRIEVVINVKTVDIVTCNDIGHHLAYMVTVTLQRRIEVKLSLVLHEVTGTFLAEVGRRHICCALCTRTVRVYPCMQFHIAPVTLLDHECQGIPTGREPLYAGDETAPWLQLRRIESIALHTHLEYYCIHIHLLQIVEHCSEIPLHLLLIHP